ncbi:MAG: ribulose-phosphate 3-epimerase, partial [Candidatus Aenigmatarchaeota archaeon]
IESIRSKNLEVGIAVNPYTKIEEFEFLLEKVDTVLFMSVEPGFYGSPFITGVLEKIKEFKKLYPNKTIGIDGGIKLDNFKEVKNIGVDYICIGSAILKAKNPKEAYFKFLNLINEQNF